MLHIASVSELNKFYKNATIAQAEGMCVIVCVIMIEY